MNPKPSQYYEPMDIDGTSTTKFTRCLPLTDSEKQCHRDNKLCMYYIYCYIYTILLT